MSAKKPTKQKRLYYRLADAVNELHDIGYTEGDLLHLASTGRLELLSYFDPHKTAVKAHADVLFLDMNPANYHYDFGIVSMFSEVNFCVVPTGKCAVLEVAGCANLKEFYGWYYLSDFGAYDRLLDVKDGLYCDDAQMLMIFHQRQNHIGAVFTPLDDVIEIKKEQLFITHAEVERLRLGGEMTEAQINSIEPPQAHEWKRLAWNYARGLYKKNKKMTRYKLAVKVSERFKGLGMVDRTGKPFTAENIYREALTGVTGDSDTPSWERKNNKIA